MNVWCFDVASTRPGGGVAAESCRQVFISTQFVENSPLFTHKWAIILLFGYKLSYIGYSKPASLLFLHIIVYIILFLNRQLWMWRHSRRYIIDKPRLRAQNNTCSQPNYSWKQRYWSEITPRVFVFRVWTLISSDLNLLITSPRTWIVQHSCWCCVQVATLEQNGRHAPFCHKLTVLAIFLRKYIVHRRVTTL